MAKKFAGFTPEQLGKIVPEMQGMQGDEQSKFLAANPAAASRVGKMAELAQKRIGMAEGGFASLDERLKAQAQGYAPAGMIQPTAARPRPVKIEPNMLQRPMQLPMDSGFSPIISNIQPDVMLPGTIAETIRPGGGLIGTSQPSVVSAQQPKEQSIPPHSHTIGGVQAMNRGGYAEGGTPDNTKLNAAQQRLADAQRELAAAQQALAANPEDTAAQNAIKAKEAAVASAQAALQAEQQAFAATELPSGAESTATALTDPSSQVTTADVATVSDEDKAAGEIAAGTGQVEGTAPTATQTTADTTAPVTAPTTTGASTYDATTASPAVQGVMDKLTAATGKPSAEALAEAATMSPDQLAQLGLTVEQIAEARRVQAPDPRKVEAGEMIEGSTVDMERVKKEVNFEAATGAPSTDATVQGQLTGLMEQFEGNEPPAWAAGAMRSAAAMMAARGLSASSMAGQAAIQAAMESALPIAQADAATFARFEQQNLSNRQQAAMFAAEKRAEFLGLEFTQEFQARVANAAKISDIANQNFSAEQTVALENARMAQTVDLANMNAKNAKIMADAAAMSQLDMANLNNRQQAAVQQAQAFLEMDMANLSNQQQTSMFKAQELANALLNDTAAENAAKQFNASSENQTNQFFASLATQVAQFNNEQANAMNRFNAGEANALSQFNTTIKNQREMFNAQNHLVVAQANAQWSQNITTMENAAQNQANRDAALAANNLSMTAYNNLIQKERDLLAWAWQSAENQLDRDRDIMVAKIKDDDDDSSNSLMSAAAGKFLGQLAINAANNIWT